MTVVDKIKFLDRKIQQNEEQYDLDRKAAKISAFFSSNLDKNECLTGENLDLKPSNVEQARFEYSPLSKFLNKGLKKEDKKEGPLKRLKNIEDKINGKNEEQSEAIKNQSNMVDKRPKNIMLLKAQLDYALKEFHSNFTKTGQDFLKKLAKGENDIDYNNLVFKIDDSSVVKIVVFLEEVSTMYDLLIYLLGNAKRLSNSAETRIKLFKTIDLLEKIISKMKNDITDISEEQKKEIFAEQESVLNNVDVLLK